MQKLFALSLVILALTGCIRKIAIEQGNVITPELTSRIHVGMSQEDVKLIMGSPMVSNTFSDDRVDYVYTFKPGNGTMTEKYMTLSFQHGVLQNISGNVPAENKSDAGKPSRN